MLNQHVKNQLEEVIGQHIKQTFKPDNDPTELEPPTGQICIVQCSTLESVEDMCTSTPEKTVFREDTHAGKLLAQSDVVKKQIIIRIKSWTRDPVFDPDEGVYYVDVTERQTDFLLEEDETKSRDADVHDQFERNKITQDVNDSVKTIVNPILKRLEILEEKVTVYENSFLNTDNPSEVSETIQDTLENVTSKGRIHLVECRTLNMLTEMCLDLPERPMLNEDEEVEDFIRQTDNNGKKLIIRITAWICTPYFSPDQNAYYVDRTERRTDLLVEEREEISLGA